MRKALLRLLTMSISTNALLSQSNTYCNRGAFIVLEGVDRCGKTTQCGLLANALALQKPTEAIRFPDRTSAIGSLINSYLTSSAALNDQTIHLLFSANRWEASSSLESKLAAGTNLVCDRYAFSGVAFSSAKGLDLDWCMSCDRGLPAPDAVIYLDISVEDASERGQYGEERYEKIDFQRKVRDMFMAMKDRETGSVSASLPEPPSEENTATASKIPISPPVPWFVLNSKQSIADLHSQIHAIVSAIADDVKDKPIRRLWM